MCLGANASGPQQPIMQPLAFIVTLLQLLQFANAFYLKLGDKVQRGKDEHGDNLVQSQTLNFQLQAALPKCWSEHKPKFNLYTRGSEEGHDLSHLVLLVHGFYSRPSVWSNELAEVILAEEGRREVGVVTVDWEESSRWLSFPWGLPWKDYSRAVANTRCIAEVTAVMVNQVAPSASLHCVGHSLGAHICGFTSNRLEQDKGRKMERITGLDPAGIDWTTRLVGIMEVQPMEILPPVDTRLDASDGILVDIIHTDGNFAGTMEPMGHVDFYVGRSEDTLGSSQKGCGCKDNCDHARSFKMFIESVKKPLSPTKMLSCEGPRGFSLHNCEVMKEEVRMGYFYKGDGARGVVGVLVESDGVEAGCLVVEEEDWDEDWDDEEWEDEPSEEYQYSDESQSIENEEYPIHDATSKEDNSLKTHEAELIPLLSIVREIQKGGDALQDESKSEVYEESSSHLSDWPWQTKQTEVADCNLTCLALLAASICFFLLCLLTCTYLAIRTYMILLPTKDTC